MKYIWCNKKEINTLIYYYFILSLRVFYVILIIIQIYNEISRHINHFSNIIATKFKHNPFPLYWKFESHAWRSAWAIHVKSEYETSPRLRHESCDRWKPWYLSNQSPSHALHNYYILFPPYLFLRTYIWTQIILLLF